jgi:hypothetical protein
MIVATAVGVGGLHAYPFPRDEVFLELIAPLMTSVLAILAYHHLPPMRPRPLPRYPVPEQQPTPTVVLGEAHFASVPGQASEPAWLTIPQRGLYTGVIIRGAVGTGTTSTYQGALRQRPWTLWTPHDVTHVVHPYDAELDAHLTGQKIPFDVRTADAAICADRRHWLEAIDRWFTNTWRKLDSNVKASIVEGVVVFLSLFDENSVVYRAFSPARAVYADPKPGEPQPLSPLEDLLETSHVLGLNFPVALNPALARGWR